MIDKNQTALPTGNYCITREKCIKRTCGWLLEYTDDVPYCKLFGYNLAEFNKGKKKYIQKCNQCMSLCSTEE